MSKIQKELANAANVAPAGSEKITDAAYVKRLLKAVADLDDKAWNKLSKPAQDWFNDAADQANAKKPIPAYPDLEPEPEPEEEKPRARRRAAEPEEEAVAEYSPKVGDEVAIVTKRGTKATGVVVLPDDDGELVLKVNGEEVGYKLTNLDSITPTKAKVEEEKPSRRRAAEPEEEPADPEVGDTVKVVTKRGKEVVGNITEIDSEVVVLKDSTGEVHEFDKSRVESIEVKVKNAKASKAKVEPEEEKPTRRRGAEAEAEAKPEADKKTRASKDGNGGVSVTLRAREIMCDDPLDPIDLPSLLKALKKEDLEFNDNTIKMVHADCVKMFTLLKDRKHLK